MNGTNIKDLLWKYGFLMSLAAVLYLAGVTDIFSGIKVRANVYPPGDACTDAIPIGEVTNLSFDTTGARFGGRGLCMVSPNIWYCYTASCKGDVTVSLLGSSYDTMLAVYEGCECFPTANDLIACNDDFNGTYQSQITFAAIAGNQYLIEIGGYGGSQGKGFLNISCDAVFGPEKPDLGDAPDSTNNAGKVWAHIRPNLRSRPISQRFSMTAAVSDLTARFTLTMSRLRIWAKVSRLKPKPT